MPTNNQNDVQLGVGLDATGVERGAAGVVSTMENMAGKAVESARKVGKGADSMAEGFDRAAAKSERATGRFTAMLQRETAAYQAAAEGGKGSAKYMELRAQQLGVNVEAIKPLIAQYEAAKRAADMAAGSMDKIGVSAKQTAAAMRGVPAQFTDIFTSLQGGQAPLTVLLQQGGQLKDMFGGVGNAARALGGYLLSLVNPYTVAAAAAAGLTLAYRAGAGEAQAYQSTLILSGQAAGVTAGQLSTMAAAVRSIGAGSQGRAAEVLNQLAGLGGVAADNLERFTAAALRLESVGGPAAEETAKAFAALAKDPLAASLKLNESTNYLTRSVYEQIKALEAQGRSTEAARLAQESYADAVDSRTPDLLKNLGSIERGWLSIKKAGKEALDGILDIGRGDDLEKAIKRMESDARRLRLSANNQGVAKPGDFWIALTGGKSLADQATEAEQVLAGLRESARLQASQAALAADQARQVKLLADYRKDELSYLPKIQQYQAAVLKTVNEGVAAGEQSEAIQRRVAALREKYFSEPKSGKSESQKALEAEAKASREAATAHEKYFEGLDKGLAAGEKDLQQLRDRYVELVAGKQVLADVVTQQLKQQAVLLEIQAIRILDKNLDVAEYERRQARIAQLRQEIALRQGIATVAAAKESDAAADKAAKDWEAASAKAAKDAAREWERAANQIEQALTDALMRGFENGKTFGANLRDTVVNLFKTMVLRPIVQAVVQPVTNTVAGYLGAGTNVANGSVYGNAAAALVSKAAGSTAMGSQFVAGYQGSTLASGLAGPTTQGATGAMGAGATTGSYAAYAGWAAAIAAGVWKANQDYNDGFNIGGARQVGRDTYGIIGTFEATLADLLKSFGVSDRLASLLSGSTAVAKIIGRAAPQVTEAGITGTLGAGDFTGSAYQNVYERGGLLRRSKSYEVMQALPEEIGRLLDDSAKSVLDKAKEYAAVLGLPATALGSLSKDIKVSLGKDAEANKAAILAALASYGDALVAGWAEALKPLAIYGETTSQTVDRVATSLGTVNDLLKELGLTLLQTNVNGAGAALALADAFGGLDALKQASTSYYEKFYTDAERAAAQTSKVGKALADVGLALPSTRDEFRALVDAADLTTEAGRTQYATLLGVADAFAQITDSGKDLVAAGKGVADYIAELRGAATGGTSLLSARAVYQADLASARNGDVAATGRIVGDAKALVDAVRAAAADPVALARETSRIAAELQSLPATLTWMGQVQTPAQQVSPSSAPQSSDVRTIMPVSGFARAADAPDVVAEKLADLEEALQAGIEAVALNTSKTVKILDRMSVNGQTVGWVA